MRNTLYTVLLIAVVVTIALGTMPLAAVEASATAPNDVATITILHTNDFHGNLQLSGSNPGMARTAYKIEEVRTAVGADNVLLVDAGDQMQGTLLSNLFYGESTIDIYNLMGYGAATFGNHEFDWGQTVLSDRTTQANFPYLSANIVADDTGDCATAGWTTPPFATPWVTMTVGAPGNEAVIGLIGVTTQETPYITVDWATEGLCFKDPTQSIGHYFAELDAASDAIVVLSHLGNTDGGYGYGFPVYGDQTLAHNLFLAGTPVDLIIGGHSHTDLAAAQVVDGTTVVQAHYAGRKVGKATLVIDKSTGTVTITWERITVSTSGTEDPTVKAAIDVWASDPWYQAEINRVVGFTNVPIVRNYNGDSLMGAFVNDAIYNDLNTDAEPLNDVDMVFNNAGGLRADITFPPPPTTTLPVTLTHGMLYSILPFGNATVVGDMTGAQIVDLLNQSATLATGALQVAGVRYDFYRYNNALPGPQPWAWGAFNIEVYNRAKAGWEPIDPNRTYRIATNEFLAPAGQDQYKPFKYVTNISYWGDMLNGVERWVSTAYTKTSPYEGALDGRITRDGDDTTGNVVAVTLLHNNDPHGNLYKSGSYPGLTQLATLVNQERAKNPDRTLLFNAGDTIQGDAMSYYFKTAPFGYAADGTPIVTPTMWIQPSIAAMNAMGYDAMTLGNHEFNFGGEIFAGVLKQANFPMLGANVTDDGRYGLDEVGVLPFVQRTVPGPSGDIYLTILGITNHRVPNYELPSNIVGLTFTNPISKAQELVPFLASASNAVVALTHIGFTDLPGSLEVDNNVDTFLAANVSDIDVIIGAHSHTNPDVAATGSTYRGAYKYLPAIVGAPDGDPVLINQAYRYNNYLGEVVLGFVPMKGGYDLVSRAGRYIKVDAATTPEDPTISAIIQPYRDMLTAYNNRELGCTTTPIDALQAFTQETNGANLQADSSVWELAQNGVNVDFHLSGAMTNKAIAAGATITDPVTLKVSDMFTLMPYENSLVAMTMNGPQLKTVLERSYRNYWYYKYRADHGGYSYYTTCFLDTNAGNQIIYYDGYPMRPNGHNVAALMIGGVPVDFSDAGTYYTVSTVNYLAAGSCNMNDGGVTLWPLGQIVADTQLYVRDAVINYVADQAECISPAIEGRVQFLLESFYYLPVIAKH